MVVIRHWYSNVTYSRYGSSLYIKFTYVRIQYRVC